MALIVEDGTGLSTAEAYVSVTDATAYFAKHGSPADWTGATTAEKEVALRTASRYLDMVYTQQWKGERVIDTQAMDWPRWNVTTREGFWVASDEMPTRLVEATCEAAIRHLTEDDGLMPDLATPGTIQREKRWAGPVGEEIEYAGGRSQYKRFTLVERLLVDLIEPAHRAFRA